MTPESKPLLLRLTEQHDEKMLKDLTERGKILSTIDTYSSQLRELFAIQNPALYFTPEFDRTFATHIDSLGDLAKQGVWAYFPWQGTISHILDDIPFQQVRTARNKHLISASEQEKFYGASIGIAGLSVGNSVALAIVLSGGAKRIKLADPDTLDLSNLNRIRAGVDALGVSKVEVTARQIYVLNPYAKIELYNDGLHDKNIDAFFEGLTIVIDELDNLAMKWRIRERAKVLQLPVLMAADNDRMGVIDIERYDLDPHLEFFHGRLAGHTFDSLSKLEKKEIGRTIAKMVGLENHTPRMLQSLTEMGKSVASWPQLGATALMNGSLLAYAAMRIANGLPLAERRVIVGMDELLDADFHEKQSVQERERAVNAFKELFNL